MQKITRLAFGAVAAATLAILPSGAFAQVKKDVVVYTSYEKEDLAPYKAAFEKDNPNFNIVWVHDANGVITARLLAEKSNPRADAVWGVAASSMGLLAERDVLQPYAPAGIAKVPAKFRDKANPPAWFGNSAWVAALAYNTVEAQKIGSPPLKSWKDLTNPAFEGKLVMAHPASSGTGFLFVSAWLQTFGEEEGWKFMDALHKNMWRYTHSGSQPATLAARGEAIVGISFDLRAAREKAQGGPIDIIFPTEGLGWEMNALAIVKSGPNPEGGKALAEWGASDAAMKMYAETRSISARPEFARAIPNIPNDLADRIIANDFEWAAKNRERILAEWSRRYEAKSDPKKQ
jgi:iron(III) transport system substrate-binding protein